MIKVNDPKLSPPTALNGFHMTFSNGWTVSVQSTEQHQCDPKVSAEVGVWDANGEWLEWSSGNTVCGHVNPDRVAEILDRIASIHPAKQADHFSHIDIGSLELKRAPY